MNKSFSSFLLIAFCCLFQVTGANWKAGVAKVAITPANSSMRMGGYANRTHGAEGKLHDLWVKALALEDENGNRGGIVTFDLLGLPKNVSDEIRGELGRRYGLKQQQLILNASHTHSAPIVDQTLYLCYSLNDAEKQQIQNYKKQLIGELVEVVGKALQRMKPARVYSQVGTVRFQVNRRNNTERILAMQDELKGPNDYSVPVLKVTDLKGKIVAITFGYACHSTVLDEYRWSGDWPGFAQLDIEKRYPGAVALFTQGAGADQNPLPRRTIPLAVQYGKEMATAVERVLSEEMNVLEPTLQTAYREIDLPFKPVFGNEELTKMIRSYPADDYRHRWATQIEDKIVKGESFPASYPYPIQIWRVGAQNIFTFGGELTIQYAINTKRLFGYDSFVYAYSNDLMGYIPSDRILKEGCYEGYTAQMVYDLPSLWADGIEETIMTQVGKLATEIGLVPQK